MAKKTKRKVSTTGQGAAAYPVTPVMDQAVPDVPAAPASRSFARRAVTQEFNPDYSYVVSDLKRIGILAGSFFVLLIALSFIMPLILR